MANQGEFLTKEIKKLKNKIWLPRHRTYVESTQDVHKSSLNVFTKSYANPNYLLCPGACKET